MEMSQHFHVFLLTGASCPNCDKIYRSIVGLLSDLRAHDRPLKEIILFSMMIYVTVYVLLHRIPSKYSGRLIISKSVVE